MPIPLSDTVILVTRNGMGEAEPELQLKLAGTYFKLLDENNLLPAAICFYTDGVKLTVEDSPVLESLQSLVNKGVRLNIMQHVFKLFQPGGQSQSGYLRWNDRYHRSPNEGRESDLDLGFHASPGA